MADYLEDFNDCDAVSYINCKNYHNIPGFTVQNANTVLIDLTQRLDDIWDNMNDRVRKYIKKGQKMDINIEINKNYEEFFEIYRNFQREKGFGLPLGVDNLSAEAMARQGILFTASYQGKLLGGIYYLTDITRVLSLLSASKRLQVSKEMARIISIANLVMEFEAIKYFKNQGFLEYDLGGLFQEGSTFEKEKHDLNQFKLQFGGKIVPCYHYHKVYSNSYLMINSLYQKMMVSSKDIAV